ncbi:MAG: hypothetical protein OXR73_00595 [Myxococcales bacterium]|nr:hypothetical protein [Myxococcales bacterium]
MKRLRDMPADTPLLQRAQEAISSVDPVDVSAARRAQIRAQIERAARGRPSRWRVSGLVAAAVLVVGGASALAAVRFFVHAGDESAPPPPRVGQQNPTARRPALEPLPPTEPSAEPSSKSSSTPSSGPPEPQTTAAVAEILEDGAKRAKPGLQEHPEANRRSSPAVHVSRPHHGGGRKRVRASETWDREAESDSVVTQAPRPSVSEVPGPAPTTSEDPHAVLVYRAMRALRREGDPERAARLLERYRSRGTGGPLAQEALALHIEAAVALRDPRARVLAGEYLRRFPEGRYAPAAKRARRGTP